MTIKESLNERVPSSLRMGEKPRYVLKFNIYVGALICFGVFEFISCLALWFINRGKSLPLIHGYSLNAAYLLIGAVPILVGLLIMVISAQKHKFLFVMEKPIFVMKKSNRNWYFILQYYIGNEYLEVYDNNDLQALENCFARKVARSGFLRRSFIFLCYTLLVNAVIWTWGLGYGYLLTPLFSSFVVVKALYLLQNVPLVISFVVIAAGIFFLWPDRNKGFWRSCYDKMRPPYYGLWETCRGIALIFACFFLPIGLFLLVWGLFLNLYYLILYVGAWKIVYTKENRADYSAPWLGLKNFDAPYSQISFDPFAHTIAEYEKLVEEYKKLKEEYYKNASFDSDDEDFGYDLSEGIEKNDISSGNDSGDQEDSSFDSDDEDFGYDSSEDQDPEDFGNDSSEDQDPEDFSFGSDDEE